MLRLMDYVDILAEEGARIGALGRRGPLNAAVPHIPRWRVHSVIAHLGGVHRWAARIVAERHFDGQGHKRGTETGDALLAWFDEGVDELTTVLAGADPSEPCGNFSPASPNTVRFWHRRQAHETAMHRWDVESALGLRSPFDRAFASDGIDELLHTFTRSRGKQVLSAPIGVAAMDTGEEWTLTPAAKPGRVDVTRGASGDLAARMSGPAEEVLLALWKRVPFEDAAVDVEGDKALVAAFVAGPVSP